MEILVTGGAGFIGSHTCVALLDAGYSVVIADDLSNSQVEIVNRIEQITGKSVTFHQIDVTDQIEVEEIFSVHNLDGVIHFAGFKAVRESTTKPIEYYYNNTVSTMVLAKACIQHGIRRFVFSSSATVYGDNEAPFTETMKLLPTTNPYGETKLICERILKDTAKSHPDFYVSILRYFNPVGAHKSGLIGESPSGIPNNLMPLITQVAKGVLEKLEIFGGDYPTEDGTGIRDYVHVMDLASGHVAALDKLSKGAHIYNLGTGRGTSVLQLLNAFQEVNSVEIPYEIVGRRPGDVAVSFADVRKAKRELGWEAERGIIDMCKDAWQFEKYSLMTMDI